MKLVFKTDLELHNQMVFFDMSHDTDQHATMDTICVYRPEKVPEGWTWELFEAYLNATNDKGIKYSDAVKTFNHELQYYCLDQRLHLKESLLIKQMNWAEANQVQL